MKGKETSCTCTQHISRETWKQAITADGIVEIALSSSQSSLNPELAGLASNACTLIAGLVTSAFMHGIVPFTNTKDLVSFFNNEMRDGNDVYNINKENMHSPFLNAYEAAEILNLKVKGDIYDVMGMNALVSYLESRIKPQSCTAFILIIPAVPAVSIAICQRNDLLYFFDSHCHGKFGAIIALCKIELLPKLLNYINKLAIQTWNVGLPGSNLTQMDLM